MSKKDKAPKPMSLRQIRKFLAKSLDECSEQELNDRYRALWDLIQDNPPTHPLYTMWLDEQAKIRTLLDRIDAKKPFTENVGDYGNDQHEGAKGPTNTV